MQVIVEADGGSRGNPGPAGYGAVVLDASGASVLAERAESIGTASNNVAEYRGLIAGLEAAIELGADAVAVRMDSKLVVEQMSGRWQVKHPDMRPLARRASQLTTRLESVTFEWIPRERNRRADRLANLAMDRAAAAAGAAPAARRGPARAAAPASALAPAPGPSLAARVNAVARQSGDFTLRSGARTDEYFDKYRFESDPVLLRDVAAAMVSMVSADAQALAGLELGGVPLATMLSQLTGRPARFVRKQAKDYGTAQVIEGGPVDGLRVVVVEDVVTTGAAVLVAVAHLRAAGATVRDVLCAIDRSDDAGETLTEAGLRLRAVLTRRDLDAAGLISP